MGVTNSNKVADTAAICCGDSFKVTLALTAAPDIVTNPTDIVLVLDRSGSLSGPPFADMKAGAKTFIDIISESTGGSGSGEIGSGSRMAVVSFASTASADAPLTTSVADLKAAVDALSAGGGTNHGDAFQKAQALFDPASANARTIVMFTDGVTTSGPAPGPIAAANSLGLDGHMLLVIGIGALVSIPVLIVSYFFAKFIGKKVASADDAANDETVKSYDELVKEYGKLPNVFLSFAPIVVPILLMAIKSIVDMTGGAGLFADLLKFLGTPMISLAVGLIISIGTLAVTGKMDQFRSLSDETLRTVGPILFVTAAGGVLGKVISEAGIVAYITENAAFLSGVGIFFPFLIAAILKTAQGSSTVAITTTAGIMGAFSAEGGLMAALGLTSPLAAALTVMAIGAGAMTVSHANDSYFWVVTEFGGMKAQDGYKTQTLCTLVMGVTAIVFIWLISLFLI